MKNYAFLYSVGKTTISGSKIETKNYSVPICCEHRKHSVARKSNKEDGVKRDDSLSRSRMMVRQRVWANITPHSKFLTLTTADTVLDVKEFRQRMSVFFKAMKRDGYNLRYLYVLERQKERGEKEGNEGSIHAHIIIFNDEYIPSEIIKKHWNGRTEIKMINGLREENGEKVRDVGAYVCKYVTKESNLEWGSRCFNCSLGLLKPLNFKKTIYGDGEGEYYPNDEDSENEFINFWDENAKYTYRNAKIIQYDFGDGTINQIIDYKQGDIGEYVDGLEKTTVL